MKTAAEFLDEGAKTFRERNAIYGDNYLRVGGVLAALFPNGLTLRTAEDFNRFHIFMLGVVKQSRYCVNWDKGGHPDSTHDLVVYSAMLEAIDAAIEEAHKRLGSERQPVPGIWRATMPQVQPLAEDPEPKAILTNTPRAGDKPWEIAVRLRIDAPVEGVEYRIPGDNKRAIVFVPDQGWMFKELPQYGDRDASGIRPE